MSYNLFFAYDLMEPGQNYNAVQQAIKELGRWHQFQFSLFYVHTEKSAAEAFAHVANHLRRGIDRNDRLMVIDAQGGVTTSWDRPPIDAINAIWFQP